VVGKEDNQKLVKPLAFVVLKPGSQGSEKLAEELKQHIKARLAPHKYPRWIEFVNDLPKTATGKIQRFKLRELAASSLSDLTPRQAANNKTTREF
jgi:benzoate-CoA ligase